MKTITERDGNPGNYVRACERYGGFAAACVIKGV